MLDEEKIKVRRLIGHFLRLNLLDYFLTDTFKHMRFENNLNTIWANAVSKNASNHGYSTGFNNEPNERYIESTFLVFIDLLYDERREDFPQIIESILHDVKKYGSKFNIELPLDTEILDKVETVLIDLGYDKDNIKKIFSNINPNLTITNFFTPTLLTAEQNPRVLDKEIREETPLSISNQDVFIVHGHDTEMKQTVARFIERIGLSAIILHEQPNQGRNLLKKFRDCSKVGFAIILLTPDDIGMLKNDFLKEIQEHPENALTLNYESRGSTECNFRIRFFRCIVG